MKRLEQSRLYPRPGTTWGEYIAEQQERQREVERRIRRRDRRIRERLLPWAGIKLFQRVRIGDRQGRLAIIQRHWPHHWVPVWNVGLKRPYLGRCRPMLRERYIEKMGLFRDEKEAL